MRALRGRNFTVVASRMIPKDSAGTLAQMTPCDIVKHTVISADSRARNRLMLTECSATGVRTGEDILRCTQTRSDAFRGEDTTGITAENPPVL